MHLVITEPIFSAAIGDADGLMRLFNRAVQELRRIDQNNVAAAVVTTAMAVSSGTDARAPTLTHEVGGPTLLSDDDAGPTAIAPDPEAAAWTTLPVSLSFTTYDTLRLVTCCSGQYAVVCTTGSTLTAALDVEILVDGESSAFRSSGSVTNSNPGRLPWLTHDERLVQPGAHTVTVRARDRGDSTADGSATDMNLICLGVVR